MQKLYCYVDETGQDVGSQFFIVVAIISSNDQHILRERLIQIEKKGILEALETAIKSKAEKDYQAIISIDGIDKKKAAELTNALRLRGIKLRFVRSARDESEPLIRLADMWAGCLRGVFLGKEEEKEIYEKALRQNYFLNKKIPPAIPKS